MNQLEIRELSKRLKSKFFENYDTSKLTWFRSGGKANFYCIVNDEFELKIILKHLNKIPFYILGKVLSALLEIDESMATQFAVSMINAILTALSCVMIFRFSLDRLNFPYSAGLFLSLGFGLSTIAWCYSEDFMSEPAATLFLLSAVYFATNNDVSRKKQSMVLAGTFLAIAISCRMASLVVIPGFVLYEWMIWKGSREKKI